MNFVLSDQHRARREEFRRFAKEELDQGSQFPVENLRKAARMGYLGLPLPHKWNGGGTDFLTYTILIEELSRICAATGLIIAVHTSVGSYPLYYFGTEEQKQRYLTRLARGELLGAFALTEAGAGSDAGNLSASAHKSGDGYILNGTKLFITSGDKADLYTVFATSDRNLGHKGISAFLVEKNSAGLIPGKPEKKMGLNRSNTTEVRMEDLYIPASNRLGEEGMGFSIAMALLDGGRIGIAAQALGLARAAIDYTKTYLKEKQVQSGKKIGQDPAFKLANLATKLEASRLLVYRAAQVKESGKKCSREAAMAKYYSADLAMEAATCCIDICGFPAACIDHPLAGYFCDAKATQIYEGTNQIQRMVVARELV